MSTSNRDHLSQAELLRVIQGMEQDAASELHEHTRLQTNLQNDNRILQTRNEALQKSHEKLEASLAQYMSLYEHAPIPCVCVDSKGIIRQTNLAGAQMLGASKATALNGLSVLNFLAEDHRVAFLAHLKQAFLFNQIETTELQIVAGEEKRFMRLNSIALPMSNPKLACCWSTYTDITDLKRAEWALRTAGVNVKAIFDNAGHPMWSIDRSQAIIASNDAFQELRSQLEPNSMLDEILKGLYVRALSGERCTLEQALSVSLDPSIPQPSRGA